MNTATLILLGVISVCVMGYGSLATSDYGLRIFMAGSVGLLAVVGIGVYRWYSGA